MTAIVGVLNRRGLAFAADSAATHRSDSGLKITNNANKIFSLSKYHPVGIALYNNLDFMGIPWDSIIKQFRDTQKEKKYDELEGYVKPFFSFVKTYCSSLIKQRECEVTLHIVKSYFDEIYEMVKKELGLDMNDANANQFLGRMSEKFDECYARFNSKRAEDFKNYKQSDFEKQSKVIIDSVLAPAVSRPICPNGFEKKFVNSLFAVICNNSHIYLDHLYTGLVFFGYGDKDLFPSLLQYRVTCAVCNRIKYTCEYTYNICSAPGDALIIPFAQTDVSNTVVRAVEDKLRQKFYDNYKSTLEGVRDEVISQLNAANAPLAFLDVFRNLNIDKYAEDYKKSMDDYITKSYIQPLMETVAFLDKEDLADMAESLVRMTCLKRHITSDAETVGGAVDVAIVTKGDGFIWKKRKHYFDPELNSQFFERYKK